MGVEWVRLLSVRWCLTAAIAAGLFVASCCPSPDQLVNVRLVNNTSLEVDPKLMLGSETSDANQLFVEANYYDAWKGSRVFAVLAPGEVASFSLDCGDVATIGVDRPVFTNLTTNLSVRSGDSIVLQRPSGFDCAGIVMFTYSYDSAADSYEVEAYAQ